MDEFDYIIVGAGSAGCVLANRLSASGATVCVLEAGPVDRNYFISMPVGYIKNLFNPKITWQFQTEGSPGTNGRRMAAPQGRVLGGTSAINGLAFVRGQVRDYDHWRSLGNAGWGYSEVLPYFRRIERRMEPHDEAVRGNDGPLRISDPDWKSPLCEAFIASALSIGIPLNADYNGQVQEGTGYYQRTIERARRVSSAKAYFRPALASHRDIRLLTDATVESVILTGTRATGVRFRRGSKILDVKARREVILSAGALNTPKLLELSGIGSRARLAEAGIEVLQDLPGVGENLQDHYGVRLVARIHGATTINQLVRWPKLGIEFLRWLRHRESVLGISAVMCYAFTRSDAALPSPDTTIMFTPASYQQGRLGVLDDFPGATIGGWQMRPSSVGHVHVASNDPFQRPVIQPNYLSEEADQVAIVRTIRKARDILNAAPFSQYAANEVFPGKATQSDDELLGFARQYGAVLHHWCGSCRMGPPHDRSAVVDNHLRVHGLTGLRIVDASVLPTMVSANTYATVLMIAEKAADMILGKAASSPQ